MSLHRTFSDRSNNIVQLFVHSALPAKGFANSQNTAERVRRDILTAFWIWPRLAANMTGSVVERPVSYGSGREVGSVGRCLMHENSTEITVYALKVCGGVINGNTIKYTPPLEKLLVSVPPELMPHISRHQPPNPFAQLPVHLIEQIQGFAVQYLDRYTSSHRSTCPSCPVAHGCHRQLCLV